MRPVRRSGANIRVKRTTVGFILVFGVLLAMAGCGRSYEEDLAFAEESFAILDVESVEGATRTDRHTSAGGGGPTADLPARVSQTYRLQPDRTFSELVEEFVQLAVEDGWTIETQSETGFATAVRGESAPFFRIQGYRNGRSFVVRLDHFPHSAPG